MLSALLGLGLSVLPKIPQAWDAVANIVGKAVPSSVSEAASMAGEVISAVKEGKIPPEQKKKLEEEFNKHEEKIMELAISEMDSIRKLEIEAYKSGDQYIARTRPMILRRLFYATIGFAFSMPIFILVGTYVGVNMSVFSPMVSSIFEYMSYLFGTAFVGYAAMRTRDKANALRKNGNGSNGLVDLITAIRK